MNAKIMRTVLQINEIEELDALLDGRERMRRMYADMQTLFLATRNPLWNAYLKRLAAAGKELNLDIEQWYQRQSTLFADVETIAPEDTEGEI